jgi:hypothetical protein
MDVSRSFPLELTATFIVNLLSHGIVREHFTVLDSTFRAILRKGAPADISR